MIENDAAARFWPAVAKQNGIKRATIKQSVISAAVREPMLSAGQVDAVTFTSASTVRGFVGALGPVKGNPKVVCIGPVTAKEARAHGLTVSAVANPHTIDGVVEALERVFSLRRRAGS